MFLVDLVKSVSRKISNFMKMISYWLLVNRLPRFLEFFGVYHHYRILGWAWFTDFYIFIKNLTSENLRNHKKCRKVKPFDMPVTGYKDWLFIWRRISSLPGVTWSISCSIYSKGTVRTEYQGYPELTKRALEGDRSNVITYARNTLTVRCCLFLVKKDSTIVHFYRK